MKLETAKRKYHNQWIAFKYSNESKNEGEVLIHTKNRKTLYKKLDMAKAGGKVYLTFCGQMLPKNCSILFRQIPT
jgi:hypothetical protein